eukprot:9201411-Prorocentrum_lima.AAC.1
MPLFPMQSACEAFDHLSKALGVQGSSHHHTNINPKEYTTNKIVLALDFGEMNQERRASSGYFPTQ